MLTIQVFYEIIASGSLSDSEVLLIPFWLRLCACSGVRAKSSRTTKDENTRRYC